jgi:hypothetical protein
LSRTSLDHELVGGYMSQLNAALRRVPAAQARELREQITAHLDDALPPDADDEQVAAVLGRLGSPAELAADAGPAGAAPLEALAMTIAWLRRRLARVHKRTWAVLGVHVLDLFESAQPEDPRPRQAIEHARAWVRGEVKITQARTAAVRP